MEDSIKVSEAEIKQFAESIGAPYVLTSALRDTGIDQAFVKVIENIESHKNGVQGSLITTKKHKNTKDDKRNCKC
jgi:predicted small secreted protein